MRSSLYANLAKRWTNLELSLLPARVWQADRLTIWRERIVLVLCLMAAYLGPLVLVPSLILAYIEGRWAVIIIDCTAYLVFLGVYLGRRRSLQLRVWTVYLVVYCLGVGLLLLLGFQGAGYIWLFTASVLAGALLGLRMALLTLILNLACFLFVALLLKLGLMPWARSMSNPLEVWLVMAVNFMLLNTLVTITTALMLRGLESALEKELEASANLRQSEARFRDLSENSPDIIFALDPQGRFSYVNPCITSILGYAIDDMIGQPLDGLAPSGHAAELRKALDQVTLKGRSVHGMATQLSHRNGQTLTFLLGGAPHGGDLKGPYGVIGVLKDITEQMRLARQLQQAQKMEALGTLAGGIAHDFNNILGVVIGFSEIALQTAKDKADPSASIREILKASDRARALVKQILTFSRKEEGDLTPLNLNREIRDIVELLSKTIPKMITIETHLDPDLMPVMANANQIEQVLLNLGSNAQDAMPGGGRLVIETQNLNLDQEFCRQHFKVQPGPHVLLMVSDTGVGMDAQIRDHIFEPFFTTKEAGKGTGLGLSTIYGIVKGFGGQISCYSEPGTGTTFKIYLPAHQQSISHPAGVFKLAAKLPGGHETILLVDDEDTLRDLGAQSMSSMGYQVLTAKSGEEALEVYNAQGNGIDLVIMDLSMPGMGGVRALKAILEVNPAAKVMIASGYTANGTVKEALLAGAMGYVAKPFRLSELLNEVRNVLDKSQQRIQ